MALRGIIIVMLPIGFFSSIYLFIIFFLSTKLFGLRVICIFCSDEACGVYACVCLNASAMRERYR